MSSSGGSWLVAGRLARREVRRHPWPPPAGGPLDLRADPGRPSPPSRSSPPGATSTPVRSRSSAPVAPTSPPRPTRTPAASEHRRWLPRPKRLAFPTGTPRRASLDGADWLVLPPACRRPRTGARGRRHARSARPGRLGRPGSWCPRGVAPAPRGRGLRHRAPGPQGRLEPGRPGGVRPDGREFQVVGIGVRGAANRSEAAPPSPTYRRPIGSTPLGGLGGINDRRTVRRADRPAPDRSGCPEPTLEQGPGVADPRLSPSARSTPGCLGRGRCSP